MSRVILPLALTLLVFSPAGRHLGTIKFGEPVGNLAWGDPDFKTLYITASSTLFSVRVSAAGAAPVFWPKS